MLDQFQDYVMQEEQDKASKEQSAAERKDDLLRKMQLQIRDLECGIEQLQLELTEKETQELALQRENEALKQH